MCEDDGVWRLCGEAVLQVGRLGGEGVWEVWWLSGGWGEGGGWLRFVRMTCPDMRTLFLQHGLLCVCVFVL